MQKMTIEHFADMIGEYESDTFSAQGSEITKEEARAVAEAILFQWFDNQLDGVIIDETLAELRDHE